MKTLLLLLFVFVGSICLAAPPDKVAEELDIREATFRYLFGNNASAAKQNARSYYLAIHPTGNISDPGNDSTKHFTGGDPDAAFMKRFAGNTPPVKMSSECDLANEVRDKKTGERGVVFCTGKIRWISETEVEVQGGYYEGNLSASGGGYRVKKVNGKWTVEEGIGNHWMS